MEPLEQRALLSAGQRDLSFGTKGVSSIALNGSPNDVRLLVEPDGKILVSTSVFIAKTQSSQFELSRFTATGKLDQSFGKDGISIIANAHASESRPMLTDGGRILQAVDGNLMRFTSNGMIDTGFGDHGVVKNAGGTGLAVVSDGRILAADGRSLRRYHSDGTIDKSFGKNGLVALSDPSDEAPTFTNDLDVRPDRSIFLTIQTGSGSSTGSIAGGVMRFFGDGKKDRRFGELGFANTQPNDGNFIPVTTVLTSDGGSATLMSHEDGGSWLVKLDAKGQLDPAFAEGGIRDVGTFNMNDSFENLGTALLRHDNGKFTAAFFLEDATVAAQFNSDGSFDTGFGGTAKFGISDRIPQDAVLGRNDDLIVATIADDQDDTIHLTAIQTRPPAKSLVTLSGNTVKVTGTAGDDLIQITNANGDVTVTLNGQDVSLPLKSAKSLQIDGGAGNDSIFVIGNFPGGATLDGGGGNDRIETNSTRAVLNGGAGNDTVVPDHGGATMIGGSGNDTADFSAYGSHLFISLDNQSNDGNGGDLMNVHADIENIIGGRGNDLIIGGPFANHLYGGPGNDTLWGGGGNDTLEGGHGHDLLFGQAGADLFIARDKTGDTLDGGEGFDTASIDSSAAIQDKVSNIEAFA